MEMAGEVVEVGPGVAEFKVGDRVFGWSRDTYAELVAVPARKLMRMPDHLSFEEAACVPTVYGTAWAALVSLAKLQAGERVLIHAAGSGVGSAAVQIAKALGGWIVASAGSDWKLERAREQGANATVNYSTTDDLAGAIRDATGGEGVDIVLEGVGRTTFGASMQVLKRTGRMVIYGSPSGARVELDTRLIIFKNITIYGLAITQEPRTQQTVDEFREGGLPLLERRLLHPIIHRVFPIQEAGQAHDMMLDREQYGKLVLTVS
jgi:NADPH:quinone reductase-like Zn-dependent oxidoreductase